MIDGARVVAMVPARGGSRSVPGKNVKPLGGKPLLTWTLDVAREVEEIDRILVSTDDPEIAAVARGGGAEVYDRPASLATDRSLVIEAIRELVSRIRAEGETAELMILLEPTSPLRQAEDVRACLRALAAGGLDSVATFTAAELHPHRAWRIDGTTPVPFVPGAIPWLPRQELPPAYQLNGAVYAFRTSGIADQERALLFGRCGAVLMPRERSVDIDDALDFERAEAILRSRA